jgi:hypothetical protein
MEQLAQEKVADHDKDHGSGDDHGPDHKVFVTVITPSGIYPEDGPDKINDDKSVSDVLAKAAKKLKLTNTADWVAYVGDRQIDPNRSFKDNGLSGTIEIEWHKPEGGGGASRPR